MGAVTVAVPCKKCGHLECIQARELARRLCRLCGDEIGLERRIYFIDEEPMHAVCVEERIKT